MIKTPNIDGRIKDLNRVVELLQAELRAKNEALAAMQSRVDWIALEKGAALQSHEGQKRNTMAFMKERDEARAENVRLRDLLGRALGYEPQLDTEIRAALDR